MPKFSPCFRSFATAGLLTCGLCTYVAAQDAAETKPTKPAKPAATTVEKTSGDKPEKPSDPVADAEAKSAREEAAWGFVMRHHPQLGEVLSRLKTMQPGQYEKAINQVALAAERISRMSKNDAKRAEFELDDWRYESQLKLLAAKTTLVAKVDPDAKRELAEIIRKQLENRLRIAEYERDRAEPREDLRRSSDPFARQPGPRRRSPHRRSATRSVENPKDVTERFAESSAESQDGDRRGIDFFLITESNRRSQSTRRVFRRHSP
ncbi:MAG: hypothetical protein QM811_28715 [Pirellulales bacterium]